MSFLHLAQQQLERQDLHHHHQPHHACPSCLPLYVPLFVLFLLAHRLLFALSRLVLSFYVLVQFLLLRCLHAINTLPCICSFLLPLILPSLLCLLVIALIARNLSNALEGRRGPFPAFSQAAGNFLLSSHAPHRRPVFRSPIPAEAFPLRNASPFFGVAPLKLRELLTGGTSLLDSSAGRPHENARRLPSSFAHRARDPSGKGAPSRVFGPPDFLSSLSDPTSLSENRLPRKGRQRPALPCLQGAPPRAHTMRERQSPRLSAPVRQRELLLFELQGAPSRGPACGC